MTPHDLRLPAWGPYTKKFMGLSHVADPARGWRFDWATAPGLYRRRVALPDVRGESGYHPWEASADLRYFSHRHELEWKDQVYCDVAFAELDERSRLMRCECVNRTDLPQGLVLHGFASLHYPAERPAAAVCPPGVAWVSALDYRTHHFGETRPADGLASDLLRRGETRGDGFGDGSGLLFNRTAGDAVEYGFQCERLAEPCLLIRARQPGGAVMEVWVDGRSAGRCALIPKESLNPKENSQENDGSNGSDGNAGDGFFLTRFPLGALEGSGVLDAGEHTLRWVSLAGGPVAVDGFAVLDSAQAGAVRFEPEPREPQPERIAGPRHGSLRLRYPGLGHEYGVMWDYPAFQVREFVGDDLDLMTRHHLHNHVATRFHGEGRGHYTDVYLRPIDLPPRSTRILYAMVCAGTGEETARRLAGCDLSPAACEPVFAAARATASLPHGTAAGAAFEFSQARMSATTLCNVVYPTRARAAHVRHNTPGRWWDSLYTWDSGFIGLGLAELDTARAVDCLKAYLTAPGDPHAAFVHHGSPVPVQHYLFQSLWNRTGSRALLGECYAGLRQYHRFLSGADSRSSTGGLRSGMLQTWPYFYNSGGWDDYPPQHHVHEHKLEATTAPVVNTAHAIRSAKILRMAARELGLEEDAQEYDAEIAAFTRALQTHAWDEASGYFGYVCHDAQGRPTGILRDETGGNFNRGLDGLSPLVAGVCTPEQRERMLGHLRSESELWTPIGLSTVDQSAPYYRQDGYWNGAVWMPHQWFVWKALLDLGETDLAFRIADTALRLWATEVDASFHCFEHFIVKTGRGGGWHQFGGLSTPVLSWFAAYYTPGTLTGGLDLWVHEQAFSDDHASLRAVLSFDSAPSVSSTPAALVAVMRPGGRYHATWNGEPVPLCERLPGCIELRIPFGGTRGVLEIQGLSVHNIVYGWISSKA